MEERFYYQQGMCEALSLNSLNPILYQGEGEKNKEYHKVRMVCSAIESGLCTMSDTCGVFLEAPETAVDDGAQMVKEKYRAV